MKICNKSYVYKWKNNIFDIKSCEKRGLHVMVLKLSFIMIGPSERVASSSYTSHHCYTEERNVAHKEIFVWWFRQVISKRATFLCPEGQADQPANSHRQAEHRDPKKSIEWKEKCQFWW